MRYIKVKVSFCFAPKRLYRVLLVPEETNLVRFAQILGDSLHFEWEHLFRFSTKTANYEADYDDFVSYFKPQNSQLMRDCTIENLGGTAVFEYDFGEGWKFNVRIYKRRVEREGDKEVWLLEGAGQGIWEDEIFSLISYLDGIINDSTEVDEDSGYSLPWNFENTKFSDFDKPLDLELEQKYLDEQLERTLVLDDDDDEEDDEDEYEDEDDLFDADTLDDAAVMQRFEDVTGKLDRLGTDVALHKWVSQSLAELRAKYGELRSTLLVMRMLMDEQENIANLDDRMF